MNQLDVLEAFVAVAQFGGFSAASRELRMPVSTISRKVAMLEASLGVRLFIRSTRHVALTELGRHYFEACRRVLSDLKDANEMVSGEHRQPKGELTLTAPQGFGRRHLQPVVEEFLHAYPNISIHLRLEDRVATLVDEHIDCALRISDLQDSALVVRHVGHIQMVVCASPEYLAQRGTPMHPDELTSHDCISWTSLGAYKAWEFQLSHRPARSVDWFPIKVRFATTTADSALDAAINGMGLVQATSYQVAQAVQDGRLVPVLRSFECAPTPVSLVFPSRKLLPLKLRAFLDFASPRLSDRLNQIARVFDSSQPR